MGLIQLNPDIALDGTDERGILLDSLHNLYFELDHCQTLLLFALLQTSCQQEAINMLHERIEADDEQLLTAIEQFCLQLETHGLAFQNKGGTEKTTLSPSPTVLEQLIPLNRPTLQIDRTPLWERAHQEPWEFFLTGIWKNPTLPSISCWRRIVAAFHVVHILLLFRHHEKESWLIHATQKLRALPLQMYHGLSSFDQQRLARRELIYCQFITRLISPCGLCIPRSLALCAYLRSLGFAAQFVIGRASFSYTGYEFHAWVEVAGHVVNDDDVILLGYSILQKIP